MNVIIVGTSSPIATLIAGQAGTSVLVESGDTRVLLDCGPGATARLNELGVDIRTIATIVLTHHHWDHVSDLPHFVLGRWEASQFGASGGKAFAPGLSIIGPIGTKAFVERLFGHNGVFENCIATRFSEDIGIPLYGTRDIPTPFPPVVADIREVVHGDRWTIGPIALTAADAVHCQPYLASLAYRLAADGAAMVFSGDSAPCESVTKLAASADLLLHDCNVSEDVRERLGRVAIHSTAGEVARLANEAQVSHVVAVHHGLGRGDQQGREVLKARIAAGYGGRVTIAREGDRFALG